jgi:hypothetical protein
MKHALYPLVALLFVAPAFAQETVPAPAPEVEEGFSMMEQGAKLLFKGLMAGMEPAMDDMSRALTEMQPALKDLMAMIGDINNYHAPEMLENGDIIIRRKLPSEVTPTAPEIEL